MRILHLIDSGGLYGAERMLLTLMQRQREAGHDVRLLSAGVPGQEAKAIEGEAEARGLPVQAWRMAPRFNRGEARRVLAWIHAEGFDVLHSHGYKFNVLLGMFSRSKRRAPLVCTLHGYIIGKRFTRSWLYTRADQLILPRLDAVALVSEGIRAKIPRVVARRTATQVIPNGIDLRVVREQAEGDVPPPVAEFCAAHGPVLLGVGRLSPEKAFDRVLEIAARLRAERPELGVVIVGEGSLRDEIESMARALDVPLLLPGFSDRVPAIMRQCDLLCMPSHTEGLPLTLLEAMTVGLPIAATPVGEITRVLEDGLGGTILDPAGVDAMARQIADRFDDDAARQSAVEWSRARVESVYSSEAMAARYEEFYRTALDG